MTALADMGPKPSVIIDFKDVESKTYFVALLSEKNSTGPWNKTDEYRESYGDRTIWEKFNDLEDDYFFLGMFSDCSDTNRFKWTYYPPDRFKIAIYYPEYDRFEISGIYERYAFDSYFTMNASTMKAVRSYNFNTEILSFIFRLLLTVAIEILIALFFGYRSKSQLRVILITNICTQVLLNLVLNLISYKYGGLAVIFNYVWLEIIIITTECLIYSKMFKGKLMPWLYSFTANTASFAAGLIIYLKIPAIF